MIIWSERCIHIIQMLGTKRIKLRLATKFLSVLAGIAELIGAPDKLIDITVAIDKIDKIGIDKVNEELSERGLGDEAIAALRPILEISGSLT